MKATWTLRAAVVMGVLSMVAPAAVEHPLDAGGDQRATLDRAKRRQGRTEHRGPALAVDGA